ncbi:MAG TPA: endonuclease/exonuclease/phosphatase family protein [Anaerolineales bacterium]
MSSVSPATAVSRWWLRWPVLLLAITLASCARSNALTAEPALADTEPAAQVPTATSRPTQAPTPTATRSAYDGFLQRPPEAQLRVMTYNVHWDSIFPADDPLSHDLREFDRQGAFARILRAVQPDILCLQEINQRRLEDDLASFLTHVSAGQQSWQAVHVRDTLIASPFRLVEQDYQLQTRTILPILDQAAALIDLPDEVFGPTDLYMVCAHFKSGGTYGDVLLRVRQADAIMAHLRDSASGQGGSDLAVGTPYLVLGDFNIYDTDPARQRITLLQGDIHDEGGYGPDWSPDWDGTALTDALPTHNDLGDDRYTWRADASPLNPGVLDRIFYTDSVLQVENAFVFNTALMTEAALARHSLQWDDVMLVASAGYFDHLPIVADFSLQPGP